MDTSKKNHGNGKITTEKFIRRAQDVHGDKYNYSKSTYTSFHSKLTIICPTHGEFQQSPYLHLRGSGCPDCYGNVRLTTKKFIEKARGIHGDKYNYSEVNYINNRIKININCPEHGIFKQAPTRHLCGDGCPDCGIINTSQKNTNTTNNFIKKALTVHGDEYNYSYSQYVGYNTPITIICNKHGKFQQSPYLHLSGSGCPDCGNHSKGELRIKKYLEENQIVFERQKMFNGCKGVKRRLPFDFYLPEYNILIEFDGIQHFKPVKRFGGEMGLQKTKINDGIKNHYCNDNSIKLIRIKYNENIVNKLKSIL